MALDVRAIENIATAPATRFDRFGAASLIVAFAAVLGLLIPFGRVRFTAEFAAVPAALSAAAFAAALTAILLYLQYRVARQSQLALLSMAYATSAAFALFTMLTYPGLFAPSGLFHAGRQTVAWLGAFERGTFSLLLAAFACADRFGWRIPRPAMRLLALGVAVVVAALIRIAVSAPPTELVANGHPTPFWLTVVLPINTLAAVAAIVLLLSTGLRTVTQVWLTAVALIFLGGVVVNGLYAGERFTIGWYGGRSFVFTGAIVILAVFLYKINQFVVGLAGRTAQGEARYRSLANLVPQLIWTADARGTIDSVNDRWEAYTGLDAERTRERDWCAAVAPVDAPSVRDWWNESLRDGTRFVRECRLRDAGGRARWFLVDVVPVPGAAGRVDRWIASCTDIDRSKHAEEREAFLAAAGSRLSDSLDLAATLTTIRETARPLAGWSHVELLGDDGNFAGLLGPSAWRLGDVLATGKAATEDDPALSGAPAGMRALLIPLMAVDAPLGALILADGRPGYPDADEVSLASEFGRRASLALDHARRFERERATADSFQRAMLPQQLPQVENVSFSASYSAASESRRVGGDFYDAFVLPNGYVALTIGDVSGHGLEAAVVMGEIRQGLRASAWFEETSPAQVLDRASRLLASSGRSVFVTAVFGVLDPQRGRFLYATAGHAPPILAKDGELQRLPGTGLPLGLRDGDGVDFAISVEPGSTIVLYTDGLIEFGRDLSDGERRLDAAIRALAGSAAEGAADDIMRRVLADDQATDDIAILTATLHAAPQAAAGRLRAWRFSSDDASTAQYVRREVGALVGAWTGRPERGFDGELAFGELHANVVRHAPGTVRVRLIESESDVELRVVDRGPGFAGRPRPAEAFEEHGRGLQIVRATSDAVDIAPAPGGGTAVSVRFHRTTARRAAHGI